jgi:hypothetical protein
MDLATGKQILDYSRALRLNDKKKKRGDSMESEGIMNSI